MKYKYLKNQKERKARKKNTIFIFQIVFFVVLIIVFLSIGAFLFYKKLTSPATFTSVDDIPQILKNEKIESDIPSTKSDTKREDIDSNIAENDKEKITQEKFDNLSERDFSDWNKIAPFELQIVNKSNSLPKGFNLDDSSLKKCNGGKKVSSFIYDDLIDMIDSASKSDVKLWVCSGYRDYNYQKKLFDNQLKFELKSENNYEKATKKAAKTVAFPGKSEHNLGLAVDMNSTDNGFEKTTAYKWLSKHAHEYGFIERYKSDKMEHTGVIYEPWHYRYVGKKYAKLIKDSGLCLEEYAANEMSKKNKSSRKS